MTSANVRDVNAHTFIKAYANHLKRSGKLNVPEWVDIVKTGTAKELAPYDRDWFYIRAGMSICNVNCSSFQLFFVASIARHVYLKPGLGVGALQTIHGSSKNRGSRPSHHTPAAGNIIRKALQALEVLKIVEKDNKG